MNISVAPGQLWPGIFIQVIDMVHPPGMGIPPIIERHQATVAAREPANASTLAA
jgi:hypothetical protein